MERKDLHLFRQDKTPIFRKTWTTPLCPTRVQTMMAELPWPISICKPSSSLKVLSNYCPKVAITSLLSTMIRYLTPNSSPLTQTFSLSRAEREYRISPSWWSHLLKWWTICFRARAAVISNRRQCHRMVLHSGHQVNIWLKRMSLFRSRPRSWRLSSDLFKIKFKT